MKNFTFLFLLSSLISLQVLSQKKFTDSLTVSTYMIQKGQIIEAAIDTVYLMNTATYKTYNLALQAVKNKQNIDLQIEALKDEQLKILQKRITEQSREFKELNKVAQNLLTTSEGFAERTGNALTNIDQKLQKTSEDLTQAKQSLDTTLTLIKTSQRNRWKLFGNGFIIGALASAVTFILIK